MIPVLLKRITSTHENLRTPEVKGFIKDKPALNKEIILFAEAINPIAMGRIIRTTKIKDIKSVSEKVIVCNTRNSTYEIQYL
jgi:hypothetical protein